MKKVVKILQLSTHNENCGIAKYQKQYMDNFKDIAGIQTSYFEYSPNQIKLMTESEKDIVLEKLAKQLSEFDIIHIQHELSFFKGDELSKMISVAKSMDKKVIVTVHTAPAAQFRKPEIRGLGPRSFASYSRAYFSGRRFLGKYFEPLKNADIVLVHNKPTKNDLLTHGFDDSRVIIIKHPVSIFEVSHKTDVIRKNLQSNNDDIIYATVGFMSRSKGIIHAVKALSLLPERFKLAIIGGIHPDSDDTVFYDEVVDLIVNLQLRERVYITGFIRDDRELNALIKEVDVCVYPYDKNYYSFVSSGSLNLAISNYKPTISYKTDSFIEINEEDEVVLFCDSPNYYELARELKNIDVNKYTESSKKYADNYSWVNESRKIAELYKNIISS